MKSPLRHNRWLLYVVLIVFAALSLKFVDGAVAEWVHAAGFSPSFKHALGVIRMPGNYFFTIALAIVLYRWGHWSATNVATLLLSSAVAGGVTTIVKFCCGRMRPFRGTGPYDWKPFTLFVGPDRLFLSPSFPSSDTALAFATAAIVSIAKPQWRWAGYLWALSVGVARVLQNAHYPSDVAIGAMVGLAAADCCRSFCYHRLSEEQPRIGRRGLLRFTRELGQRL